MKNFKHIKKKDQKILDQRDELWFENENCKNSMEKRNFFFNGK